MSLSPRDKSFPDIVHLNVGGTVYTTTKSTLTQHGDSMLGRMFGGLYHTARDEKGHFFIDRDGLIFRHILNFLRTAKLVLPGNFDEYQQLREEADFYQIQPLITAIHESLESQKTEHEAEQANKAGDETLLHLDIIEHNQLKTSGKFLHVIGDLELIKTLPIQLDEYNQLNQLQEAALLTDYHPHKSDHGYTWHLGKNQAEIQYINYLTRAEINAVLLHNGCTLVSSSVSYTNGTDTSNHDTMLIADKWMVSEKNLMKLKENSWARRALPPGRTVGFIDWTPPN